MIKPTWGALTGLLVLIILTTFFLPVNVERSLAETGPAMVLAGDANGDGKLNALDITKAERIIAGLDTATPEADANFDGNINAQDVTKIERLVGGLDKALSALTVHFIDVGQGDAILIDLEDVEILIDGGKRYSGVQDSLGPYIDGALEVMVATHPDADHIGGLIAVLDRFEVREIWLNGDSSTTQTFVDFMNSVSTENATIHEAERGNSIDMGILSFAILNPAKPLGTDTNNNSIVLSLSYGQIDFLFTGDAEEEAESSMLGLLSDIEILKVGHHGSKSSSSLQFLDIIKPEVAIYSAGAGNQYGHPHQETLDRLKQVGATIYGTDISGTIKVTTNGARYAVETTK